ncbi:MAG: carbonic anhydrase [Brevinematia bacterium]
MKKFIFITILIFNISFSLTPDEALKILERAIISSKKTHIKVNQKIATILICSEMETRIDNIFKLPKEKLYVVSVLGNVALEPEIASVEYSLIQLQSPLVVIMGHYNCRIIGEILKGKSTEKSINSIVETLNNSIERAGMIYGTNYSETLFKQSIVLNVYNSMENLIKNSRIVKELISMQKIKVVGAIYNENKGNVEWLGEHPMQKEIMDGSYNSLEFLAFYKENQKKTEVKQPSTPQLTEENKNQENKKIKTKKEVSGNKSEVKVKETNIDFLFDKKIASPRKPAYITIRISTYPEANISDLTVYAEELNTKKKSLVFKLPELKIINGTAQAQFYFAGRIFKRNLYLKKGTYRIVANISIFKDRKLLEKKVFPVSREENVIRLY